MPYSPSLVPAQPERDVYLVQDDLGGRLGRVWREIDEGGTDREMVLRDLLSGEYSDPVRVIAFNTEECWSRDVSAEFAVDLSQRCADLNWAIPACLRSFIERHFPKRQSA